MREGSIEGVSTHIADIATHINVVAEIKLTAEFFGVEGEEVTRKQIVPTGKMIK